MSITEKIKDIELELSRTQINKATMAHICSLRARLVRYKREITEGANKKVGGPGDGFDVKKLAGSCRVGLVGFPSVGKSSLLSKITTTESYVSSQQFSTLTAIPGTLYINGSRIQVLDLPGIVEGACTGDKGRGRRVLSAARTSDLLLIILDATQPLSQKAIIENELASFGIRLNRRPPAISMEKKSSGGITFRSLFPVDFDDSHVKSICTELKLRNIHITIREPNCTLDDLIDALEGNRTYMPALYVYNKIDSISKDELYSLSKDPHNVMVSVQKNWGIDGPNGLLQRIWESQGVIRVYTKPPSEKPDFDEPLMLKVGQRTVADLCDKLHRDLRKELKYATVWGSSAIHATGSQNVGPNFVLHDEDVVKLVKSVK